MGGKKNIFYGIFGGGKQSMLEFVFSSFSLFFSLDGT